jgi:integrase
MSNALHELYVNPIPIKKEKVKKGTQKTKGTSNSYDLDKLYRLGQQVFKSDEHTQKTLGLVICIGVTMGLRIQDILNIKTDYIKPQVDSTDFRLVLKETKWNTPFDKMIPEGVADMLGRYMSLNKISMNVKDEKLFINPKTGKVYTTHWVNKRFGILQREHKWLRENDKTFSSHSLRKSYAMHLYRYYGNDLIKVKEALHHSSVKITELYLHGDTTEKKEVHDIVVKNSFNELV